MSKKNGKKTIDPNAVNTPLEVSSEEVLTNEEVVEEVTEEVTETPVEEPKVEEAPVKEEKEEEPVPVPVEPGPVIIEEEKKEEPAPEPVPEVKEEPKVEAKEKVVPTENSKFAGEYVLCIYATPRKSIEDIVDELNSNRRFVADNIIVDHDKDRVVLETSDSTEVLRKTQKKYISAGIKTVIDKV